MTEFKFPNFDFLADLDPPWRTRRPWPNVIALMTPMSLALNFDYLVSYWQIMSRPGFVFIAMRSLNN